MPLETLAERLKDAREKVRPKMRQVDVAERLGVNKVQVSEWETGKYAPNSSNLHRLSALYGVSTQWLLTGKTMRDEVMENPVPRGTRTYFQEVREEPKPYGPLSRPTAVSIKIEQLKRDMIRLGATDAEADFIEETFRRPETARLAHHDSDGSDLTPEQVEAHYDALIDGVRAIIMRRIDRRRKGE